ncbi:LPS translocon maturation chaperone LptM [Psychrobacter arenosus]|uniref:LPS translocon maturation chaperone LptM n=1 Tax=Psychrobacter arenosus TaxID=256326 RepID=UPI00191A2F3C|nr:lipoprotein [Psychrobacter arenosus]
MKTLITSPAIVGAALLTAILASSGCGQKGALYLPDAGDSQAVVTPTAENTNLDDLDNLDSLNKLTKATESNNESDDLSFLDPATEQQILDDPNNY